jgi:tryptophan synthase alpha chain
VLERAARDAAVGRRYATHFAELDAAAHGAFIPFTVLGFPDRARCAEQLDLLAEHADALELGIPFSDPVADGPTIQHAATDALAAGATPASCLKLVAKLRERHPDLPIGLLVYANLVVHRGLEAFYTEAARAGVDSVLVADVPAEEGQPFADAARAAGVAPVFIAPPNADDATLERIATLGEGYTYVLTRAGVTGTEQAAGLPAEGLLARLASFDAAPPVLGFGIATPEQVQAGIAAGAAGVISGSAVVKQLRAFAADEATRSGVADWFETMHAATQTDQRPAE